MPSVLDAAQAVARDTADLRARAVESLKVPTGQADDRFERITALARLVFDVPSVNVTILDGDLFWVHASDGADLACYPRVELFCDATVRLRQPVVSPDTSLDPRFRDLALVTGSAGIRFYAGAPIYDSSSVVIGTLCLLDTTPREFSDRDVAVLQELAGWAYVALSASTETTRAREVQQQLLPGHQPEADGYSVRGVCIPSHSVGGDNFDWGRTNGGFALMLSDVMGKGAGAAILSATVRSAVRAAVLARADDRGGHPDLARLVADVDRALRPDLEKTSSLVTAFFAHVDPADHVLRWVDAGHGLAVVVAPGAAPVWLRGDQLPLGLNETDWTEQETPLPDGARLVVFSDGLLDLLGGDHDAMHAIAELARDAADADDVVATVTRLAQAILPVDDVTAVAVAREAAPTGAAS